MSALHTALEALRPKDFADVPTDDLKNFLPDLFTKAELIVNSVPPPPDGTPFEQATRARSDANGATSAATITVSNVRRPSPLEEHCQHRKAWGKPLKMSAKDAATGISVYKMAGHDRHGAWFARTSVHEGLGFAKWKKAMMREFPESLAVQGGPGEGNIRGIGGDKRLEDVEVEGIGKMEVYQLSAQFPGPTSPREFITLLLTSENALTQASQVAGIIPRHFMVVSIPVTHPEAPPRDGLVRGMYESVEMIREIPLAHHKSVTQSSSNLLEPPHDHTRSRGATISYAESRGPQAKGERIDRKEDADDLDPETNPVEWIMITRSDPGGGIPRFMVERGTPSSIVQDAGKFLDWACSKDDFPAREDETLMTDESSRKSFDSQQTFSVSETNGILAGVGTSIADRPFKSMSRRASEQNVDRGEQLRPGMMESITSTLGGYVADAFKPELRERSASVSSASTSSSTESFASATQYATASDGLPIVTDGLPTPSTLSEKSVPISQTSMPLSNTVSGASKEMQRIEEKRKQLEQSLAETKERQEKDVQEASLKSAKELEKATEKHQRERKRQEEKFQKEVQKLEARRERETKKLLEKQRKEAEKNALTKAQRERDEWKEKADLSEQENKLLKEQIGELQRENTVLVARMGKSESGMEILRRVREDMEGGGRKRASSRTSRTSVDSIKSDKGSVKEGVGHSHLNIHEESQA